ncbi:MAG: Yip1 family protein [bacterium]
MNLFERVKAILFSPAGEWEKIKAEQMSVADMFAKYAAILAAIPAIAGFIGQSVIGYSILGAHYRIPMVSGLIWAILYYLLSLVSVYVVAIVIDALAPSFGAQKDQNASMKVAVFSATASWVAGIFQIIPPLSILGIVGLYSFYLLWVGLKSVKDVPQDKMIGYYLLTVVISIAIYFVVGFIVGLITIGGSLGAALSAGMNN